MHNNVEAELKKVEADFKRHPGRFRRDPNLTGGLRVETPAEKLQRKRRKRKQPQPPVIERTP